MNDRMATQTMAIAGQIESVAAGEELAWDALYREQMPRILNFFRYRVGQVSTAEDLTAITFEKAWRNRHRYRSDLASFATWLFAIARNVARDYYRQRKHRHLSLELAMDVASAERAESLAEQRSDAELLGHLLEDLTDRERELVSLKYGAECTNREIAKLLRLTESNVGTILHRAVKRLQERWPKEQ